MSNLSSLSDLNDLTYPPRHGNIQAYNNLKLPIRRVKVSNSISCKWFLFDTQQRRIAQQDNQERRYITIGAIALLRM